MKSLKLSLALLFSVFTAADVFAIIGVPQQAQLGNPSGATADPTNHTHLLVERAQYVMDYNDTTREPNWVSWDLTTADVGGSGRSNFIVDTTLPAGFYQVLTTDYSGSGYDRGHMCPSADRTVTVADNQVLFYMSNMIPQSPDNNQGVWASFETYCRTLANAGNEILITSGPSLFAGSTIASGVAIPGYTWKIAVVVPVGAGMAKDRVTASTRVITIKIPNVAGVRNDPWEQYVTSVAQIEADTGYHFFTALPGAIASALKTVVDGQSSAGTPSIVSQPVAQSATLGGNASFSVTATGDATLTYQWLKDDDEISGATASTLNLTNVQLADFGVYTVTVSNLIGSVTSNGVALTQGGLPPTINTPPASQTVSAGTNVVFSVAVGGSPTFTYQWRKDTVALANGGNVTGATTATLNLANVQSSDIATYDVMVTNSVTSVTSPGATLGVTAAAPSIVTQPAAQSTGIGGTAVFTVVAEGTAPLSYQWRKAGSNLTNGAGVAGATGPTLTLTGVALADAVNYDVLVSNAIGGPIPSNTAALTVSAVTGTVNYAGGTYTQNFDTLANTGSVTFTGLTAPFDLTAPPASASGMTGWRLTAGTGAAPALTAGTGSSNSGAAYSFGAAASTDRALGSVASGTTSPTYGVRITNNTGTTITQFTLNYTGEEWRNGGNTAPQSLQFAYAVNVTDINSSGFIDVAALSFTSPTVGATALALDGNLAANKTAISSTVSGLTWLAGQTIVLRWTDTNDTGNDHGLAIDDLSFTTPVGAPVVTPAVSSTIPVNGATNVSPFSPISVAFNQPMTVAGSWFTITSAATGPIAATVTGGPTTFTLTPPVRFADNDTITVNIVAAQVADQATGTLHPVANTTFSFVTAVPVAPSITTQPVAQSAPGGGSATFTVVATGTAPLSYQWRKGGVPISGNGSATSATLVLTGVQAADAVLYDVVVSNGVIPAATSNAVLLTVVPTAPTITTAPVAQTVAAGGTATFTVAATGSAPFTYQWRKEGSPLSNGGIFSGVDTATLTLTGVAVGDTGNYDVVVSNGVNPSANASALLTVTGLPGGFVNYAGGTYSQNFDTLLNTGSVTFTSLTAPYDLSAAPSSASGLAGWRMYANTGAAPALTAGTGTGNAGAAYSFGAAATTERALGSVASGTTSPSFGVRLTNTTSTTITQFTLNYVGEEWRNGGNTATQSLQFAYAVNVADINSTGFTNVAALSFTSPTVGATAAALDGNLTANKTAISSTVSGLTWLPGQTIVLRWADTNDAGNDHGLAIDDLTFVGAAAPVITVPPASQSVALNAPVTFSVTATGLPAPTYQWYKDGNPIIGAIAATYSILNAQFSDIGGYTVAVTNSLTTVTSTPAATLSVTQSFAAWATAKGLTAGNNAPGFDAEGDGVPNQIEYILGLNPLGLDSAGLPKGTVESGQFDFRFVHDKTTTAAFTVEQSTDLLAWSPLATSVESSTATTETLIATLPLSATKQFVRLTSAGVSTVPVGFLKTTFALGTTTAFGLPLDDTSASPLGQSAAKVESFTATTITNSLGGWTGNLANASAPWAVRFTSGAANGKLFDISANTTTTLTLAGATLDTLGVAVGDTFELVSLDTLGSLFGASTLQGGTSSANADVVQLRSGATWLPFYYDTTLGFWRRTSGAATNSNDTVIRPGSSLLLLRRSATLTLTFTGRVLGTTFRLPVNNASTTGLTTGFPMDTTLAGLGLQNLLSGWRSGTTTSAADSIGLYNGSAWVPYVFNGTNWQTATGVNSDAITLPAGGALLIQRPGSTAGTTDIIRAKAY